MGNGGISPYSGGSGGAGGPSGSGGRSPLEAMYTIIAVAIVLVFALIVELWKYPWQVWAFFAGIGILGITDHLHYFRTHGPGENRDPDGGVRAAQAAKTASLGKII